LKKKCIYLHAFPLRSHPLRYLSLASCKSRNIFVALFLPYALSFSLSHALFSQSCSLSRANCKTRDIIVLFRTRCSRDIIVFSFVCVIVLSFICSSLSLTHSLTFASSFSHLCIILQCVVLVPRHPCRTLMTSLSHCLLRTLSAILFPHVALSFSHLSTVLFPRIPLLLADSLVHPSRRGSSFPARDITHRAPQFLLPRA